MVLEQQQPLIEQEDQPLVEQEDQPLIEQEDESSVPKSSAKGKGQPVTDEQWAALRGVCGELIKPGSVDGVSAREQVLARSYTTKNARKRLGVSSRTFEAAVKQQVIPLFKDPVGVMRVSAQWVHDAINDPRLLERFTDLERIRIEDLAVFWRMRYESVRTRLQAAQIHPTKPVWRDLRGKFNLPDKLSDFHEQLNQRREVREAESSRESERSRARKERQRERRRQEELRQQLVAAFPNWQNEMRDHQTMFLHVGPPNSGKTHDALQALTDAGEGWYLAPLRLLAYEIFDRLNSLDIPCNLLTGEEAIETPGATITAATIEMFNPEASGECVIIDEAQMLADPDRGWAWLRAMMEAQASEIHVIAPKIAQPLIEQLAESATIELEVVEHQRLAPLRVATDPWSLDDLPPSTILVAFSRSLVLHLKTELEEKGRSVSVVYGTLPPEVRRRQADRFANGETEICVATDAVGMGLNLPAQHVCFYEVEKFDGRQVRLLTPGEVQQIGGRAGRYGMAESGLVGATTGWDLDIIRDLYYAPASVLTHARIAPTVEDLALIPGTLMEQLVQWSALESIPEELRNHIKTADMNERIELSKMLTPKEVEQLGLEQALKLVNAPTRRENRPYWRECVSAILRGEYMPFPEEPPAQLLNSADLERFETCVARADIYLWLAGRKEFEPFAERHEQGVRYARLQWSMKIDEALALKLDTMRRCPECGRALPAGHRFRLCNRCFNTSRTKRYVES